MAQPGTKVDENIGCRERSQADQTEDVARRGGLIKHLLETSVDVSVFGFFELKHSTDQLIQVVIANAVSRSMHFLDVC